MFSKAYSKELSKMNSFQDLLKIKKTLMKPILFQRPQISWINFNNRKFLSQVSCKNHKINLSIKLPFSSIQPVTKKFGKSLI